jgi:TatD DNase family protein
MEIIDSHCHLFLDDFGPDLQAVLDRAREAGVESVVNVGLDVDTTEAAIAMVRERPRLHPTAGWHPGAAARLGPADLDRLAGLAARPEVVAFGEIGLDYFRAPEAAETQRRALADLLEVAASSGKPVIVHCRDAWDDFFRLAAPVRHRLAGVLLHCFSGGTAEVARALDLDCHLSFAGPVTFPKADDLRRALAAAPPGRIMVETDAPYLAPAPFRGKRNEPAFLPHHLAAMARVLGVTAEEAASLTAANARSFFGLDSPSRLPAGR